VFDDEARTKNQRGAYVHAQCIRGGGGGGVGGVGEERKVYISVLILIYISVRILLFRGAYVHAQYRGGGGGGAEGVGGVGEGRKVSSVCVYLKVRTFSC
jgi:hypothetical protein